LQKSDSNVSKQMLKSINRQVGLPTSVVYYVKTLNFHPVTFHSSQSS